ncbi:MULTISPECIES: hypothetical protein [Paraburkholderia]|uniref:hypothetical protein n=1 Tax=Paraburkholderia TaxID=1822464 RepID=UPI00117C2780|nr:hypothetical protein [Paraburkholderia phenazinium]
MSTAKSALLSLTPACVDERRAVARFVPNDPLPELSVHGCVVFYAGKPIHEAASPDAAVVYRDRLINLYT